MKTVTLVVAAGLAGLSGTSALAHHVELDPPPHTHLLSNPGGTVEVGAGTCNSPDLIGFRHLHSSLHFQRDGQGPAGEGDGRDFASGDGPVTVAADPGCPPVGGPD